MKADSNRGVTRQTLAIDEVAKFLPALRKTLSANPDAVVAITDHGKPVMALLSWEAWLEVEDEAATLETLELMANPEVMASIRRSEADIAAGNLIPGDVVIQKLVDEGLLDPAEL